MSGTRTATADAACVAQCAAGDPAGLETLYTRHGACCLALARSILVDAHHAEDAVQEAYLDLWRGASRFDAHRAAVRSWLLLLTHSKAVDRVRSEHRRRTVVLVAADDPCDERPGPDAQVLMRLIGTQARAALAELPPAEREAVVLAYWGGYTQTEIARLTGAPLGTVKSRMHGALKDLSATLVQGTSTRGAAWSG